jgi:hypothetical protein
MLQRLNSLFDEELLGGDGLWPRDRLEQMNTAFIVAVEHAFELGLESRAAASATVRIGRNGRAAAVESVIEAVWDRLCSKKGQMAASEVLMFVRERCPNIDPAYVKASLAERLRRRGVKW